MERQILETEEVHQEEVSSESIEEGKEEVIRETQEQDECGWNETSKKFMWINFTPDRDSNFELPVFGSQVYCESRELDRAAIEAVTGQSVKCDNSACSDVMRPGDLLALVENCWKQSLLLPASFLLVSVLGSIGMAAGSVVILAPEDRISIARGAWLSLLGLVFFVSLFDLLNYVALRTHIGHMFRKKYELTLVEVLDISNK
uniref:Uncharacterized protein n=1 Tax=Timema bartmani TaxID=61472 RepID=A0A7R9F2Z0_9NEOP|nr:unnamed protein product [Timema bartmani]